MRWCRYQSDDGHAHVGLIEADEIHGMRGSTSLMDFLGEGADQDEFETVPLAEATLLAPFPTPPSIRDFMAFEEHVVTSTHALGTQVSPVWYEQPVFYFTNPAAILGPRDDNPIAPGCQQWDYELEVAAVIGRPGRDLTPHDAEDHIVGYTVFCDWSARDLQAREMQVGLGPATGKDTATSLGPFVVTPDELADRRSGNGYDLAMTASVNDKPYSSGTWASLYWSFGEMLAYDSRGTELRAGDLIASGTVGTRCILELSRVHGAQAYPWLESGDKVRLEVERLGDITSTVVPGSALHPLR